MPNITESWSVNASPVTPSFSSLALDKSNLAEAATKVGEIVFGPILLSAYDIHHRSLPENELGGLSLKTTITFLDSGGYENNSASDTEKDLTREQHQAVLASWPDSDAMIAVRVNLYGLIDQIARNSQSLCGVDAIGITEKEAGQSFSERLRTISHLRCQLDKHGPTDFPIHVFGGLDPIRTPLYFLAGADIFDGLSWLRYGFDSGRAVYLSAHASLKYPNMPTNDAEWRVRKENFIEITNMQTALRKYSFTNGPVDLHPDGEFFTDNTFNIELSKYKTHEPTLLPFVAIRINCFCPYRN